ncbi:glycosyl transferase, group 1 [Rubrobacter xylanophilus DSM 9941]|uniref:Trehalose synthase n=1 Tax=Rubrobacter xylanophilus (strain DSM 9941 / JCM 11954 / NBRC 16129 / PRD-1) TaxID=266117 RepID=TRET_RUBXD|nr:glycosyltransferase [Rubrobacter xylanophilus]Q1ARU5.1 RecName: Full=Trehalose synthase; AltName: Full=Trehalose glycosyltransferring synthase [Rubrobacter xylanophilus DSM 9941]ABG05883.1 glycosyl transferase, group 1 [Rubrobacter xylanophilus DSM 9941]
MLQRVNPGHKALADYRSIIRRELYGELQELAGRLRGARVLHINATSFGGGVAEILYTLVPLARDAGLEVEWAIMFGAEPFFNVTKRFHNALQGADYELTIEDRAIYEEYNRRTAQALAESGEEWDIVFVHDPQPALVREFSGGLGEGTRWIWRCHIDTSTPNRQVLDYLWPYIADYDAQVYTMREYTPPGVEMPGLTLIPPAIDPLSPKNMALSRDDASYIVSQFGVDVERPFLLQVSRFDPWKDPLGVIDVYRMVKEEVGEVQLVLVGSMAHDDPEGWDYWYKTVNYAGGDPDIFLFSNLTNVGAIEVNAFQSLADVVIQKSIREGFGLVVSEALWKARPVVASRVGGIPMQITAGGGILIDTIPEAAAACAKLLSDPEFAREMGRRGKEHVRANFLTPRLLRDDLRLFAKLLGV